MKCGGQNLLMGMICTASGYVVSYVSCIDGNMEAGVVNIHK